MDKVTILEEESTHSKTSMRYYMRMIAPAPEAKFAHYPSILKTMRDNDKKLIKKV